MTWDGLGRIAFLRTLVNELLARGHEAAVLSHAAMRPHFEGSEAQFYRYESAPHYCAIDQFSQQRWTLDVFRHVWTNENLCDDVLSTIARFQPDVAVVDSMLVTAQLAVRAASVPLVRSRTTLIAGDTRDSALLKMAIGKVGKLARRLGLPPPASPEDLANAARYTLVLTYRQLDRLEAAEQRAIHVGPLADTRTANAPSVWHRRLPQRPLVLVSLSTDYMEQAPLLQRICDALSMLEVEGLVTTGPAIDPQSLVPPPNVTVTRYVPHDSVFPDTSFLVTHAGHGTVARALAFGVPMLCLPMGRDQGSVADRVVELGLGASLRCDSGEATIAAAVRDAMADEQVRVRARAFADELRAHPGVEVAVEALTSPE